MLLNLFFIYFTLICPMFSQCQVSVCWPNLDDLTRDERVLVVGMGATGILIFEEASFVNFAFRRIFVLPTISGLVLEEYRWAALPCQSIRPNRLILKNNPSNQLSNFKVPYLHFCLYAVVKTALSKRWTVCFWASRLQSLSFKGGASQ